MRSRRQRRDAPEVSVRSARWVRGPEWATAGLRQPGWLLMPLRLFLGATFTYAGLQKLANPEFFDASSPTSIQRQMSLLAPNSPIGPLVRLSLHGGTAVGAVIAMSELAIGIGTLVGLRARLAAVGGGLLALTFFLTVSWNTTPYYYGADIVFLFAWTPFIVVGAGRVLSVDSWLAERPGPSRSVDLPTGRQPEVSGRLARRTLVVTGCATLLLGAVTAVVGRLVGGTRPAAPKLAGPPGEKTASPPSRAGRTASSPTGSANTAPNQPRRSRSTSSGTRIGSVAALPVGEAARFTDPSNGDPAWLVCVSAGTYAGFSAICTHAGCTVQFDSSQTEFVCPCHGGVYSARTGQVLGGPPPAPLPSIPVSVSAGEIYAD